MGMIGEAGEEQRRAKARQQIEADAEFEKQQAAKRLAPTARPTLLTPSPLSSPSSPSSLQTAIKPANILPSASPTILGAAEALRGRSAEAMAKKYGFARGTAFVEGPPGHDKVDAKLTRGEAVLPQKTVGAMGGPGAVARLIKQTTGHSPQRGFKKHGKTKAASGLVADEPYQDFDVPVDAAPTKGLVADEPYQDFDVPVDAAPTKLPTGAARRVSAGTVGQPASRGNFSDGTMDAAPTKSYLDARQRGGLPAEIGMRARDIVSNVGSTLSSIPKAAMSAAMPVANTLKTAFTGDPTPFNFNLSPEAQAASGTAPSGAGNSALASNPMTHRQMENGSPVSLPDPLVPAASGITSSQQAYDTPGAIFSRSKGGKAYTAEQLSALAGPDNSATSRSPRDIYASEMLLNAAMPSGVRGGTIQKNPSDFSRRDRGARRNPEAVQAFVQNQAREGVQNLAASAAEDQRDTRSQLTRLRQQMLSAQNPEERASLQQSYLTLSGKSPKDYFGEVKGGSRTDELGNKTEDPGQMINLLTGQPIGAQKKVATRAQVKRLATELGLPSEQEAVAYLASRGVTVEG